MKRFIALVSLSVALAIGTTGCAHKQLTNAQVAKYTVTGGAVVLAIGALLFAGASSRDTGPQSPNSNGPAQPPQ